MDATYAGTACGRCKNAIQGIIDSIITKPIIKNEALNPIQFAIKVNKVIENEIAPELLKDNGGIELIDIKDKNIYVKLKGTCSSCPNATATLRGFVEKRLKELVDSEITITEA